MASSAICWPSITRRLATVTKVRASARFGHISYEGDRVTSFYEKAQAGEGWTNGGYFVLNRKALDYIEQDDTIWERDPIERLAAENQLIGFRHDGFLLCMDPLRERQYREDLWSTGRAAWKCGDSTRRRIHALIIRRRTMKVLVTGNMGYVGPGVVRRLRSSHPHATLVGFDMGYFGHCMIAAELFPESRIDVQLFGDVRRPPLQRRAHWRRCGRAFSGHFE